MNLTVATPPPARAIPQKPVSPTAPSPRGSHVAGAGVEIPTQPRSPAGTRESSSREHVTSAVTSAVTSTVTSAVASASAGGRSPITPDTPPRRAQES